MDQISTRWRSSIYNSNIATARKNRLDTGKKEWIGLLRCVRQPTRAALQHLITGMPDHRDRKVHYAIMKVSTSPIGRSSNVCAGYPALWNYERPHVRTLYVNLNDDV